METTQLQVKVARSLTETQVAFLSRMIDQGGPEEKDYKRLSLLADSLDETGLEEMRDIMSPLLTNLDTMHGYAASKPHGYAGDFQIIDMIYESRTTNDTRFKNWDLWWHSEYASRAVRNRKDFFFDLMTELEQKSNGAKEVLILGSGPATDVYEYLKANPNSKISFDLLDLDENAIAYAKKKNAEFHNRVNFYKINVLRYKTHKRYDMVWSAGLFDYFKEKHFIYLLKKYSAFLSETGEMVIGNFSKNNPTRNLMETIIDWRLNYRSEYELINMARNADFESEQIKVDKEPLGVNLFLRVSQNLEEEDKVEIAQLREEPKSDISTFSMN